MRVLVTWGSKRGGTEGIARTVGKTLLTRGFEVDLLRPQEAAKAKGFDAAIVGGALYGFRWHSAARRFVNRRLHDLRHVPVWFFSSGPLDDSSEREEIPSTPQVRALMERVGALGHATFGGRLTRDARGFPASAMAKKHAGDWRNDAQIRAWATGIARALPTARPGAAIDLPGRSLGRLFAYAFAGWTACAVLMGALLRISSVGIALGVHAVAAPALIALVALRYFRARGARDSTVTAWAFVTIIGLLDLIVVAGLIQRSLVMFASASTWIPLALIFGVTWAAGEWRWMAPSVRQTGPRMKKAA